MGRRPWGDHLARPIRRLGAGRRGDAGARLHGRPGRGCGRKRSSLRLR